jgi:signal transduction histidine kinase
MAQRERLSSLGRLSTVIAHEVRNPLMIIKTALHSLRQPDIGPAAVREATADIDEEVARLNRIVNDVLDFARPIRFELAPADLNAISRESAAAAQVTPGPAIQLDLDAAIPRIVTDAERLRIALVNLLVNARQAVHSGTGLLAVAGTSAIQPAPDVPVVLTTRGSTDGVSISVVDRGPGIDAGDLSRVFDPYFTTKRGGTGLGLPIAKNIIEGLGGTINVTSRFGEGTAIRIDLPFAAAVAGNAARRPPASESSH